MVVKLMFGSVTAAMITLAALRAFGVEYPGETSNSIFSAINQFFHGTVNGMAHDPVYSAPRIATGVVGGIDREVPLQISPSGNDYEFGCGEPGTRSKEALIGIDAFYDTRTSVKTITCRLYEDVYFLTKRKLHRFNKQREARCPENYVLMNLYASWDISPPNKFRCAVVRSPYQLDQERCAHILSLPPTPSPEIRITPTSSPDRRVTPASKPERLVSSTSSGDRSGLKCSQLGDSYVITEMTFGEAPNTLTPYVSSLRCCPLRRPAA